MQVNVTDAKFNALMATAASRLNLAAHYVGTGADKTLVHAAADMEGHRGRDGLYYACDTARLMPPLPPVRGLTGCHLTRLMRPEGVLGSTKPLSSDAFCGFGRDNAREHNEAVRVPRR